ncbi:efflux RND transporter periplasmic adaptor subunit [Limobrevibacterium gyesilva]|uniref:Efflux RND transporter periplasmic adaptor subunit n=1 Tax=Limobrevibacterium gyesilva TaxID=2991712 RepID=A0AA41YN84_9PROT|nr:efflux RND transporter periplasmic adaptor subunit [Limobrevibacterium gyesilva]MCW3475168.1 efflux RND transporter periplasmic adaptor subunit [Limobrevibacterium gyesilva]
MRRILLLLVCLLIAAGGGYWWFALRDPSAQQARGRRGPDAIPVLVAAAEQKDVPIYLDGLGTVQASAMVTIKPMVDGPLVEVNFREGQDVKVGDVLARIDPRPFQAALDQAAAKKRQDEANLANARIDLGRYQKLAATAYTSAQQADTQRALVAQLEAQVAQDQAQIDNARTQVSYTTITAPVDGRVGIRQIDAGNIVHASDAVPLTVITTLKPISVVFTLPQQSLPAVAAAMAAGTPEVLALPQASGASTARPVLDRGTLTVLDNVVDPATGTIKLKASFPNERLVLWPGAFVTVRLRVETRHGAVVVPPVAVQRGPRGPYVYLLNADDTVTRRPVTVSHEDQVAAVITEGVTPGDKVVVDGAARLTDNAKVNVLPSPTATPPSAAAAPGAQAPGVQAPGAQAPVPASSPAPVARGQRNRGNT